MKVWQRRLAWAGAVVVTLLLVAAGSLWWYISLWRQEPDPHFDASVPTPAHTADRPSVAFDRAHRNFHTLTTTYRPFAALLKADGYRVNETLTAFSHESLQGHSVLVVVNARGSDQAGRRGDPAFTSAEIDAVHNWVKRGGSLLLVADHSPYGSSAQLLAARFGVQMRNMDTVDSVHHDSLTGSKGFLVFSRQNGLLGRHAITEGRNIGERINRVMTFNGQSLRTPAEATSILMLSESAMDRAPNDSFHPVAGGSQGLVLNVGQGRVVVLGEAAMLTAQVAQTPFKKSFRAGMNRTDTDNKQFVLNIMRWLSRVL